MRHRVEGRLERSLAMLVWLDGRDPVPVADLCERFAVSRRQLLADLAAIGTMAPGDDPTQCPVLDHDEAADTVELLWAPQAMLLPAQLSRRESFAALAVGRAALGLLDEDAVPALRSALVKLEAALDEGRQLAIDIDEPGHLARVRAAVDEHRTLEIDYWSSWRDELTTRRVDPLRAFYAQGEWYVACRDHRSGQLRRFRVDRIVACRSTDDTFAPPVLHPDLEVFTAPAGLATEVEVRFPAAARWVPEYVAREVVDADDAGFTLRCTSVGESWLARLLLRTGGQVVAPSELAGLRAATARRVLERYELPGG